METLINELSLTGQFNSVEQFLTEALLPVTAILKEAKEHQNKLYIKKNLWRSSVTTDPLSLDRVLKTKKSDVVTRFKSLLQNRLFWEDSQKHSPDNTYSYNKVDVCGSSLAEACERDKIIISFTSPDFADTLLTVSKAGITVSVDNLFREGHYIAVAKQRGIIVPFFLKDTARFTKTSRIEQGQPVYKENSNGYYWYWDNLHKNHYEVFDSCGVHIGEADSEGEIDRTRQISGRKIDI
jgi:hypothetical protein